MAPPPPPLAAMIVPQLRRALFLVGIAFVLAVAAVIYRSLDRAVGSSPPMVSHEIVVERLREVAKLVASELTLRDVVIYEQKRFGSTKRVLLVVTGRVSAGINLNRAEVQIDSVARLIRVTLPEAHIIGVDVTNVTTYDERAGLWNPFTPDDRDEIQRRIRAQLITAAQQSGILSHADRSAAKALTDLLSRDGYTVDIRRPLTLDRPTG